MRVLHCLATVIISVAYALPTESQDLETIKGNGEFANNMYKILSENCGNIIFSPFSAHACLSMLYQGVKGPLLEDFANVLKVQDPSTAAEGYKSIMDTLNSPEDITLLVANKAFAGRNFVPAFEAIVKENFHSEVQSVDFSNLKQAAAIINDWVKDKTHGKIAKLFEPVDLQDAVFALVNTVYFKGAWRHRFTEYLTMSLPFYVDDRNQINVDTMHLTKSCPYTESEDLNAQILELEYANRDFSMIFVLPKEKDGIRDLEAKIVKTDLNDIMEDLGYDRVEVSLPKFKLEQMIDLKPVLSKMGLGSIFEANQYMDKIVTPSKDVYISTAVQKVVIEVNEDGSEAAVATGVIGVERSMPIDSPRVPKIFKADHPFLFFLTHKSSGILGSRNILFFGKVENPTS